MILAISQLARTLGRKVVFDEAFLRQLLQIIALGGSTAVESI
jgi:hypothetical protein